MALTPIATPNCWPLSISRFSLRYFFSSRQKSDRNWPRILVGQCLFNPFFRPLSSPSLGLVVSSPSFSFLMEKKAVVTLEIEAGILFTFCFVDFSPRKFRTVTKVSLSNIFCKMM